RRRGPARHSGRTGRQCGAVLRLRRQGWRGHDGREGWFQSSQWEVDLCADLPERPPVLWPGMAHPGQRGDLLVGLLRVLGLWWWGQGEVPGTLWDQADLGRAVWVLLPERIWPSLPVGDHPPLIALDQSDAGRGLRQTPQPPLLLYAHRPPCCARAD